MTRKEGKLNSQKGFSLMEVLVVVALIAIVSAIAFRGASFINTDRLKTASHQLFSDLQGLKQNSIINPTSNTCLGFGVRFTANNAYRTFEFDDADGNYIYQLSEEARAKQQGFTAPVTVTIGASGDPIGNVLLFDKRGIARGTNWGTIGNQAYVLRLAGESQARCVQVDGATIREGKWDGANCN